MPVAYSYLRFSSPKQEYGDSFRRQMALTTAYIAKRPDLVLDKELYHDKGLSGFHAAHTRVGRLGEFLEACRQGIVAPGSYLLVEALDRLSREAALDGAHLLSNICQHDVTVVTLADGEEYTYASMREFGNTVKLIMLFARGHDESKRKQDLSRANWKAKRAAAGDRPLTAVCPGWLRLDREARAFVPIPEAVEVVRTVFSLAADGWGTYRLAEILNTEKVPCFGRGKFWHASFIGVLLRNRAVIGEFTPHRSEQVDGKRKRVPLTPIADYYPAVVDKELFTRVQALRAGLRVEARGATPEGW